jgi:hypothetical protein
LLLLSLCFSPLLEPRKLNCLRDNQACCGLQRSLQVC